MMLSQLKASSDATSQLLRPSYLPLGFNDYRAVILSGVFRMSEFVFG